MHCSYICICLFRTLLLIVNTLCRTSTPFCQRSVRENKCDHICQIVHSLHTISMFTTTTWRHSSCVYYSQMFDSLPLLRSLSSACLTCTSAQVVHKWPHLNYILQMTVDSWRIAYKQFHTFIQGVPCVLEIYGIEYVATYSKKVLNLQKTSLMIHLEIFINNGFE